METVARRWVDITNQVRKVVIEESFPIMTILIQTPPLMLPPNVVADIAPATTPTQAYAGIVPIHSPFWLLHNQGNSLD